MGTVGTAGATAAGGTPAPRGQAGATAAGETPAPRGRAGATAAGGTPAPRGGGRLAAAVLACNEDDVLARCLESIKDICELHVSVDEATTDGTAAVAEGFGARLYSHSLERSNSYAAERNALLDKVDLVSDAEWFLWIDPDETMLEGQERLLEVIGEITDGTRQGLPRHAQVGGVVVTMRDKFVERNGWVTTQWTNVKVIRRGERFARRRHECLRAELLRVNATEVLIEHDKQQRPEVKERSERIKTNMQALLDDWREFRDQRAAFYTGEAFQRVGDWETAYCWYRRGEAIAQDRSGARGQLLCGLAVAAAMCGQRIEAQEWALKAALNSYAEAPALFYDVGSYAADAGQHDEGEFWFQLAMNTPIGQAGVAQVAPLKCRCLPCFGMAAIKAQQGLYDEALQWCDMADGFQVLERTAGLRAEIEKAPHPPTPSP